MEYYRNSARKNVLKLNRLLEDPYLTASIKDFPENRPEQTDTEFLAILESIKELAIQIIKKVQTFLLRPRILKVNLS
jgi:hypothetical protein